LSSDSGTHYKPIPLLKRELVRKYLAFQICRGPIGLSPEKFGFSSCARESKTVQAKPPGYFAAMLSAPPPPDFGSVFRLEPSNSSYGLCPDRTNRNIALQATVLPEFPTKQ
jgi:hypothetical protein